MTPESIEDDVLGKMTWDSANNCWKNQMTLPSGLIATVRFHAEPNEIAAGLVRARRPYLLVRDSEEVVRRAASKFLLPMFNEGDWCEGKPLDEDAFIAKMTLESVELQADGSVSLNYEDGDLFWGHTIMGDFDEDGLIEEAYFAG